VETKARNNRRAVVAGINFMMEKRSLRTKRLLLQENLFDKNGNFGAIKGKESTVVDRLT
jgi:hypothetical protein